MRLSDPKPAFCSACYAHVDGPTVDFEVAYDGPALVKVEDGTPFVAGSGGQVSIDDLHLCEPCIKSACELLGLKPELHGRQLREIRRLEIENAHWKDRAQALAGELGSLQGAIKDTMPPDRRPVGRPRRVAV